MCCLHTRDEAHFQQQQDCLVALCRAGGEACFHSHAGIDGTIECVYILNMTSTWALWTLTSCPACSKAVDDNCYFRQAAFSRVVFAAAVVVDVFKRNLTVGVLCRVGGGTRDHEVAS